MKTETTRATDVPAPIRSAGVHWHLSLRDSAQIILAAVAAGLLLKTFVIGACRVASGSMERTLLPGDCILVDKLGTFLPSLLPLRPGDVVVFRAPRDSPGTREELYVKRCVAGPGDTVHIVRGEILVNGRAFASRGRPLSSLAPDETFGPYLVPPDSYFVMGDNPARSVDSRAWGAVPAHCILGKAVLVYWCALPGAGRIGTLIR